ncbi:MAG: hypothetical protein LBG05_07340 [Treponema sp.]|jgi:mannan endo-1,4-beta-mannosidase|nr:hypothetical protein [Treponema sp.]
MKKLVLTIAALCLTSALVFAGGKKDRAPVGNWTFDTAETSVGGTSGTFYLTKGEFYQYVGAIDLTWDDSAFGDGMLKLDLDFSDPGSQNDWSEPKMAIDLPVSLNMRNIGTLSFDFYFDPNGRTMGSFKTQLFGTQGTPHASVDIPEEGETLENGFVKTTVVIPFPVKAGFITDFRLSIIGSNTDYIGPVYIDNLKFGPPQ